MQFDLVVIGGGINGAGIARDAAERGLSTCLVEQGDLCSSTSRWSSRLIHGGLRYLEFGELGLVHESLQERETLLQIAGHLVRPLPLLIPVYGHSRRGLNTIDFGLWIYDLLSIGRSLPGHRRLDAGEAKSQVPGLAGEDLDGAVLYHDAQIMFIERLVLENALAARSAGAELRTYTAAERIVLADGHVRGVEVRGVHTGERTAIGARAVVNAAGPWVDRVLAGVDHAWPRFLGPTKGTHIVLPPFDGLGATATYAEARADGRPFFVIPWNGLVLVGTTDTRYEGDPRDAHPTQEEIDYLLTETRHLFPHSGLTAQSVLYAYSGVRPLPRQGLRETGAITRRHSIRHHASARGLYSVIGGKITTYRHLAEEVVDLLAHRLGATEAECVTARKPLPGGGQTQAEVLSALAGADAIPPSSRHHLAQVYGARAPAVAALARRNPELALPLSGRTSAIGAEIVFAIRDEAARTLGDVLLRRCMAGLGADLGRDAVPSALGVARRHLGWDEARCAREAQAYHREIGQLVAVEGA